MSVKERRRGGRPAVSRVKQDRAGGVASSSKSAKERQDAREEASSSDDDDEGDDILARTSLDLSSHPMPPSEALAKTISQFRKLQKLNLSSMKASPDNPKGLSSLQWLGRATRKGKEKAADDETFGDNLTWLKLTDNPALGEQSGADAWAGIENLSSLAVLNASSCALPSAPPASALLKLSSLAALVLAHNAITSFASIPHLPQLNTLVLSHNKITRLPKDLAANLPSLKKLSITQNALQWSDDESPLPDFTQCSHLREVRLSGNSRLGRLPSHLSTWGRGEGRDRKGTGLETLELADCGLSDWVSIDPLIKMTASDDPPRKRRGLGNLSLKGNPIAKLLPYRQKILEAHPTLRTLDGDRIEKRSVSEVKEAVEGKVASASSEAIPREKKGKKKKLEPTDGESTIKKVTGSEVTAETASADTHTGSKGRLRGKRGGRPAKADNASNGIEKEASTAEQGTTEANHPKADSRSQGKKDIKSEKQVTDARIARRAGPEPPSNAAASRKKGNSDEGQKAAKAEGAVKKSKKRKAWDEGPEDKKLHGKKQMAQSPPPQKAKEKDKERAHTSVAAVIQLNKKHKEASKVDKPIWGQIGGAEASLGGSAWD